MASWLKVAEDLLEVVDRRAKLVANERSDEQSESKPPVSNGQEFQARSTKPKEKAQLRISAIDPPKTSDISGEQTIDPPKTSDISEEQTSVKASGEKVSPDFDEVVLSSESNGNNNTDQRSKELQSDLSQEGTTSEISIPDSLSKDMTENDVGIKMEITSNVNDLESVTPVNDEFSTEKKIDEHKKSFSSDSPATAADIVHGDLPEIAGQDLKVENEDIPQKIDHVESELGNVEIQSNNDTEAKAADTKEEPPMSPKQREPKADTLSITEVKAVDTKEEPPLAPNLREPKAGTPSMKVQEQLDEAQGLVKSAITTGKSKEARLAKVCAGLSSRLQEYKSENAQLEELLTAERERSNSCEFRIKQLQKDLSTSKVEVSRVESHMSEALAAKNAEIDALVSSLDMVKKQASVSEGKLAALQANMESMMRNRELAETRMMQALREELTSVERRAEEERAAHNATKMAAMEREVELEHRAVDASTALARMQRAVDERTSKVAELEQKLAVLEVESASLNQELQDMEARARRGQKKASEEGNQALQIQAWQEEVDRARQGQRDAESKISSLEAEVQKMRVEMAGMKRDAEHYSRQEHMELEKRYRELTDLLYHKQTQLEAMASDKAAAEFQLEKEVKRLQEAQVEAERSRPPRRASSSYWEDDADLKALEPLPLHHRHIAGASLQLQKAVKLLDSGAVTATRFLWRYPIARVLLLFYMVFVHLFLMYLLHRLQAQADNFAAQEVAASMGLTNPNLP